MLSEFRLAMYVYVFDPKHNDWIESENLFLHDIAILIDNKQKKVYFWTGEKASRKNREMALRSSKEILKRFKVYELIVLEDIIPLKIQSEIDDLLGENADLSKIKVERTWSMRISIVLSYIGIGIMFLVFINNLRMFTWDMENLVYSVDRWTFYDLFSISVILAISASIIYFIQIILTTFTKKAFLIVCAASSFAMSLGTMLYLAQGEYIFPFEQGSPSPYIFWIARKYIIIHVLWMLAMMIFSSLPAIALIYVIKTQSEIKEEDKDSKDYIDSVTPSILKNEDSIMTTIEQ